MSATCQFCGASATRWHGEISWCSNPHCERMHGLLTCEPNLYLPPEPVTPIDYLWLVPTYAFFSALARIVPIGWLLWDEYEGWQDTLSTWVHSNHYHYGTLLTVGGSR